MKFKVLSFFAILLTILFSGCDSKENRLDQKATENQTKVEKIIEKNQSTFKLKTGDGKIVEVMRTKEGMTFKGYEDKVVLLNFFATWCPPCKAEIPHLNNLKEKYNDKFEIIAVLLEENKDQQILNAFISTYNIDFPVTNTHKNFALADSLGVKTIPTMYMYAKGGKLMQKYVGIVPQEMLESDIKKGLGI